ncbi:hypothetical protein NMG60_11027729 [Bertholletia excelsa]
MEKTSQLPLPGQRQLNLRKSFQLSIRSLLTTCSNEEISKAFGSFTKAEQEALHRLFIPVITSLHGNIEDEFESVCLETQAGTILDTVEQLAEEQNMDSLSSDKTDVEGVWHDLSIAKKNEIQYLKGVLQRAEEHGRALRARAEQLRKERKDFSGAEEVVEKIKTGMLNYGNCGNSGLHDLQLP